MILSWFTKKRFLVGYGAEISADIFQAWKKCQIVRLPSKTNGFFFFQNPIFLDQEFIFTVFTIAASWKCPKIVDLKQFGGICHQFNLFSVRVLPYVATVCLLGIRTGFTFWCHTSEGRLLLCPRPRPTPRTCSFLFEKDWRAY